MVMGQIKFCVCFMEFMRTELVKYLSFTDTYPIILCDPVRSTFERSVMTCCDFGRVQELIERILFPVEVYFGLEEKKIKSSITKPRPHTATESCGDALACWAFLLLFIYKQCIRRNLESPSQTTANEVKPEGYKRMTQNVLYLVYHKPLAINAVWKTLTDTAVFGNAIWVASVVGSLLWEHHRQQQLKPAWTGIN